MCINGSCAYLLALIATNSCYVIFVTLNVKVALAGLKLMDRHHKDQPLQVQIELDFAQRMLLYLCNLVHPSLALLMPICGRELSRGRSQSRRAVRGVLTT